MIRRTYHATLLMAVAVTGRLSAQGPHQWTLEPGSQLVANGTSSVRSFACKTDTLRLQMTTTDSGALRRILEDSTTPLAATLTVPSATLDCNNGTMNGHMREALKVKEYPTVIFRVDSFTMTTDSAGAVANVNGTLTLGGMAKPIVVTMHVAGAGAGVMHLTGSYTLSLPDYGLKPPSLFLGTLKVHKEVQLAFNLLLASN